MKKKLIVACMVGLMMSGGLFGAAERKVEAEKQSNCIDLNIVKAVLDENIQYLAVFHANLHGVDRNGINILMFACQSNAKADVAKFLIKNNSKQFNINAETNGLNALNLVIQHNFFGELDNNRENALEIAKLLIQGGIDLSNKPGGMYMRKTTLEYIQDRAGKSTWPAMGKLWKWMVENKYAAHEQAPGGPKIAQ